MNRLMSLKSSC